MAGTASPIQSQADASAPLDVRLAIRPPNEATCPLVTETAESVRRSSAGNESGTECRLVIGSGRSTSFQTAKIGDQCLCPVFDTHDCVWEMTGVDDGTLQFAITVPDRSGLASLMNSLDDTGATVRLEGITPASADRHAEDMLTAKQREAFLVALKGGYYERPRGTSQEEIADELDISQGAVSKRLTAARRQIAEKYARRLAD
ncbi:MAG: helix-turn-helix domain-containing protein [Halobacteriota archaeon]